MDILKDNDLETIKVNENHKDIKIDELASTVKKLSKRPVEKIKSLIN